MNTDILRMDQWSKTTVVIMTMSHQKRCSDTMYHGELRTNRGPGFIDDFFFVKLIGITTAGKYKVNLFQHQLNMRVQMSKYGPTCCLTQPKTQNPIKMRITSRFGSPPSSSEIPGWLQEFREHLVDESVPQPHESHASSIHEPSLGPLRRVVPDNHSVYTHFPKDRNFEICHRTKITRAHCITADDKIISEGCESRNNHRYAVVVQDLATQWNQSFTCETNKFSGH